VVVNQFDTRFPDVSPNGNWLAYVSNESGRDEVYVRPWKEDGAAVLVSDRGGTEPVWRPDGSELYYRNPSSQYLVAASIQTYPRLAVWQRRGLFPVGDMAAGFTHANYDVSPDGTTFVFVRRASGSPVTVLRNVPEMLRAPKKN
jgi:eukaryotic-like serine/threonine-protein kinase